MDKKKLLIVIASEGGTRKEFRMRGTFAFVYNLWYCSISFGQVQELIFLIKITVCMFQGMFYLDCSS